MIATGQCWVRVRRAGRIQRIYVHLVEVDMFNGDRNSVTLEYTDSGAMRYLPLASAEDLLSKWERVDESEGEVREVAAQDGVRA